MNHLKSPDFISNESLVSGSNSRARVAITRFRITSLHLPLVVSAALCLPLMAQTVDNPFVAGQGDNSQVRTSDANWMARTCFGMFIHFGLFSLPAGVWQGEEMGRNHYAEWIRAQWGWPKPGGVLKEQYDTLLKQFNPVKFDAEEWIGLAAKAGMQYFVITSKHHEGFALSDSAVSEYDIAPRPSGRTDATRSANWPRPAANTAASRGQFRQADGHALVLVELKSGEPFIYYAGAGWSKGPDFPDEGSWIAYLRLFAARLASPLQVEVVK